MRVEVIASADEWNHEMLKHSHTTYFHSWEWGMLASTTFGWAFHPYKLMSSTGEFCCGIFVTPAGLSAGPIGYGGILAAPGFVPSLREYLQAVAALEEIENQPFQRIVYPPLFTGECGQLLGRHTTRETSIVDLRCNFSTLWNNIFSGNARTAIRAATRYGVKVSLSHDPASVHAFYPIYEESLTRVGSAYLTPLSLIERLVAQGADHVWFITASRDGNPVACNLYFHFGQTVFHWINAYKYELRNLYANAAMMHMAFNLALERNVRSFNLGGSYTSQQTLSKSIWGARLVPYDIYERVQV